MIHPFRGDVCLRARHTATAVALACVSMAPVLAETVYFLPDAVTFSWSEPGAWSSGELPTANDDVVIGDPVNGYETFVTMQAFSPVRFNAQVRSLTLHDGAQVNVTRSDLGIQGTFEQGGWLTLSGGATLTAAGGITLRGGGLTELRPSQLTNVLSAGDASLVIESNHTLRGAGTVQAGRTFNQGLIEATGHLRIGAVDNFNGTIRGAGGVVITSGVIQGGTVEGTVNGTFANTTFNHAIGRFTLADSVTNTGTLYLRAVTGLGGVQERAALIGSPGLFVKGTGTIVADSFEPALLQDIGIGEGQRFAGHGLVRGQLVNQGEMQIENRSLQQDTSAPGLWRNSGVMRAKGTALQAAAIDNTGGLIELHGGTVSGATVTGGVVRGELGGQLHDATLRGVTLVGELFNSAYGRLRVEGVNWLQGELQNLGTVLIQGGSELLQTMGVVRNEGLIEVSGGSKLSATVVGTPGSRIAVETGSRIAGSLTGGTLEQTGGPGHGIVIDGPLQLDSIQVAGQTTLLLNQSIGVKGRVHVADRLALLAPVTAGPGGPGIFSEGLTTFTGAGETHIAKADLIGISTSSLITVEKGHTLRTSGSILGSFLNAGTTRFERLGEGLQTVQVFGNIRNTGQMLIDSSKRVVFSELDNRDGLVAIDGDASIEVHGRGLIGGTVRGNGAPGSSLLWAKNLQDVTIAGDVQLGRAGYPSSTNESVRASGALTIQGTLRVGLDSGRVMLAGDTRLQGTGQTVLAGGNAAVVTGQAALSPAAPQPLLTVGLGHTVRGHGVLSGINVLNQGRLVADSGTLHVQGDQAMVNEGTLIVDHASILRSDTAIVQRGDRAVMEVSGVIEAPDLILESGRLQARGLVLTGNLQLDGGQTTVRASGTRVSGNVTVGQGAELIVDLDANGAFGAWQTGGTFHMGGDLVLRLLQPEAEAEVFDVFQALGGFTGSFNSVRVIGSSRHWELTAVGEQSYVLMAAAVPEPGTWVLMLSGMAALVLRVRRRAS